MIKNVQIHFVTSTFNLEIGIYSEIQVDYREFHFVVDATCTSSTISKSLFNSAKVRQSSLVSANKVFHPGLQSDPPELGRHACDELAHFPVPHLQWQPGSPACLSAPGFFQELLQGDCVSPGPLPVPPAEFGLSQS